MQENISETDILKQYEDDLKFIIEAADLATWIINPLNNHLIGNSKLKELFFLSPDADVDLTTLESRISAADLDMLREANARALDPASGGTYKVEYNIINPFNKSAKRVMAIGRALFDNNNQPYRFSGTIQEIIHEQQANNVNKKNENHILNVIKQAPIGITLLIGHDFMVEMANENYLLLVDRKEQEFVGKPLFESLPEIKEQTEAVLNNVLQTGKPYYGFEFPVTINRYGKKESTYFNFVYHPICNETGEAYGVIVVALDVTKSVTAKHTLAESEKQFRNLIMQSPVPMAIFRGKDFVIEIANQVMFKTVWRKKEASVLGKKLLDVFPELKEQKFPELLNRVYTTGKAHNESEAIAYIQGDDGTKKFYFDFEYAPLLDIDNKPAGIFVTVNDVTEKVLTRQKITDAEERARMAISAAELGVYEVDLATKFFTANERLYEIFGLKNETTDWQEMINIIHPADRLLREKAHKASENTGILEYETRL